MASAAQFRIDQNPAGLPASGALLLKLQEANRKLLEEIANIEAMTNGPMPDDGVIANARWRISQASLRRRNVAASIHDYLSTRLEGPEFRSLRTLRLEDQFLLRRSAEHVSAWTSPSIAKDWAGYGKASRDIRRHMSAYMRAERSFIYPLLEQLARCGP